MEEFISNGKNSKGMSCERCGSKILSPGNATLVEKSIFLPFMKKKSEQQKATDGETLSSFWLVQGMYTFENVGFTRTVDNKKYLTCADCEIGPIGMQDLNDVNNMYVAHSRVKHE